MTARRNLDVVWRLRSPRLGPVGIMRTDAADEIEALRERLETADRENKKISSKSARLHSALYDIVHSLKKNNSAKWCRERSKRALELETI